MLLMEEYIRQQPELLAKAVDDGFSLADGFAGFFSRMDPTSVHLFASGTSRNAACAAAPFMQELLKIPVHSCDSSCPARMVDPRPLAIYISQSGASTNTIRAFSSAMDFPSVAVTGGGAGHLADICDIAVAIPCGQEAVGPKTKGYSLTVLTLYLMALEASRRLSRISKECHGNIVSALHDLGPMVSSCIVRSLGWITDNMDLFSSMRCAYVVGSGLGHAVADEAALKVMETLLIPSSGFEFEEFLHGPACSLGPSVSGFYITTGQSGNLDDRMRKAAAYHRSTGGSVFVLDFAGKAMPGDFVFCGGRWYLRPFEQIVPFQMLSALVPEHLGLTGEGGKRFRKIDSLLGLKSFQPVMQAGS